MDYNDQVREHRLIEDREELLKKEIMARCVDHFYTINKQMLNIKQDILRGIYTKEQALDMLDDLEMEVIMLVSESSEVNSQQSNTIAEVAQEKFDKFKASLTSNNSIKR